MVQGNRESAMQGVSKARVCQVVRAGCVSYETAWDWQRHLVAERSEGRSADMLVLLEHPPTITLGRAACQENILASPDDLNRSGITLVHSDRGGDVTYHAPGQLVGYPILKLSHYGRNVLHYLRDLEEVIIRVLATYELVAHRREGLTGVWVGSAKVAAMGVRLSASGITSHGFALNVAPDMRGFAAIIPCGIRDGGVTSLQCQLDGRTPSLDEVAERVIACFAEVFEVTIVEPSPSLVCPGKGSRV